MELALVERPVELTLKLEVQSYYAVVVLMEIIIGN